MEIPHLSQIPGGLRDGITVRIIGIINKTANPWEAVAGVVGQRVSINLQCGPNTNPRDHVALHLSIRPAEHSIVRNTFVNQVWGPEEKHGGVPITVGQLFEMAIKAEKTHFSICVNSVPFCVFNYRMTADMAKYLQIEGEIMIQSITVENSPQIYQPPVYVPPPQQPAMVLQQQSPPYVAPSKPTQAASFHSGEVYHQPQAPVAMHQQPPLPPPAYSEVPPLSQAPAYGHNYRGRPPHHRPPSYPRPPLDGSSVQHHHHHYNVHPNTELNSRGRGRGGRFPGPPRHLQANDNKPTVVSVQIVQAPNAVLVKQTQPNKEETGQPTPSYNNRGRGRGRGGGGGSTHPLKPDYAKPEFKEKLKDDKKKPKEGQPNPKEEQKSPKDQKPEEPKNPSEGKKKSRSKKPTDEKPTEENSSSTEKKEKPVGEKENPVEEKKKPTKENKKPVEEKKKED